MRSRLAEHTLPGDNSAPLGIAGGKSVGAGGKSGEPGVHSGIAGERLARNHMILWKNLDTDSTNRFLKDLP
jgi:hypothetical protein